MTEKGFIIRSDCYAINMADYTEIDQVFKIFAEIHPEAEKHKFDLVPAPWTRAEHELKARHYKLIPNNSLGRLFAVWKDRLKMLQTNPT